MTRCPFCGARVDDRSAHYAGDDCPALVAAFGATTPGGQERERETHYRLNEMERSARENRPGQPARVLAKLLPRKRYGFVEAAKECRDCGGPVFKFGRCEVHYIAHKRMMARRYYYENRERQMQQKCEKNATAGAP